MSLSILGMGAAVPGAAISQDAAEQVTRLLCACTAEQASWLPGLFRHSGVRSRHMALDQQVLRDVLDGTRHSASPYLPSGVPGDRGPTTRQRMQEYESRAGALAGAAARRALGEAGVAPRAITHLVTVSCTGFKAPGVDCALIAGLGLSREVQRTHVGFMGCHGFLNGLRVARAFAQAEREARVLLCSVELCSLHYCYQWDPARLVANALFADGAAALVGAATSPATGAADDWRVAASGSCVFPDSEDAMTWSIGDHGFEMSLSKRVPSLIASNLPAWLRGWLAGHGLGIGDVGSWAVHPGGPKILAAVEESLALKPDALAASREILADLGNMSSSTALFVLQKLRSRGARTPCVVLAFGPGLTVEAALIQAGPAAPSWTGGATLPRA